jgi:hypothetical protein
MKSTMLPQAKETSNAVARQAEGLEGCKPPRSLFVLLIRQDLMQLQAQHDNNV